MRSLSFRASAKVARGCGLAIAAWAAQCQSSFAQQWPQILGENRAGVVAIAQPLTANWPQSMSPQWSLPLGSGYGGPAIVDSRVLVLHRVDDREVLEAVDFESGKSLWRTGWPTDFEPSYNPDGGPRCVPTVDQGIAVCYGAAGDLAGVRVSDGQLLWHRKLRQEYAADDGYFGAGASPLIIDDLVIVCLGGKRAGVIAVDLQGGTTRWTSTNYEASYASPVRVGNSNLALVVTRLQTLLVNTADGQVHSEVRFGSRGPTVNAATPIHVADDQYLLTASYGVGATLLDVADRQLQPVFEGSEILSSQYNTPIVVAGRIIGIDGREDVGRASLKAIDPGNWKVLWEQKDFGTAHLIGRGDQVIVLGVDGSLTLLDATAAEYASLQQSSLPAGTYRALPALSDRSLIVRSNQGSTGQLLRFDLP